MSSYFDNIPAGQPPTGVKPNFVDPENRTTATITVIAIIKAFVLIFVTLRVYSRLGKSGLFSWDDAACLLATAGSIAFSAVTIDACLKVVGRHQWDIPLSALMNGDGLLQEILFFQSAYAAIIFMAKLSIFLLYFRLFSPNPRTRGFIYFGIAFTGIFYTFASLFAIIACSPRKGETRLASLASARCAQDKILGYVMTVFNVVSDFYLLIIPMPVVWNLQMPTRKKVEVSAVFLVGILGCICGVMNSYYRVILDKTKDTMWHTVPVLIASIVEIDVGIIVGCMPSLKSFMHTHLPRSLKFLSFSYLRSHLPLHRSQENRSFNEPKISSKGFYKFNHINPSSG